jgi:hypothetical protein
MLRMAGESTNWVRAGMFQNRICPASSPEANSTLAAINYDGVPFLVGTDCESCNRHEKRESTKNKFDRPRPPYFPQGRGCVSKEWVLDRK